VKYGLFFIQIHAHVNNFLITLISVHFTLSFSFMWLILATVIHVHNWE